jgi:uncharacterized protein (DUF305 family)
MKLKALVFGAIGIAALGIAAYTFMPSVVMGPMDGMDHATMDGSSVSDSTKAFDGAMTSMMKGMMAAPTGKPDLDFMQGMIPHHQGAVDMSKVVLQFGKDAEVKTLAENVIKAQAAEIAFMNGWLEKIDKSKLVESPEAAKGSADAVSAMMKNMTVTYSDDADVDYIKSMIPHHQGAIEMAKVALQYAKDPEVLKLANEIVTAQEGEISLMQDWLKRMGK